jgi:hypothetical protein
VVSGGANLAAVLLLTVAAAALLVRRHLRARDREVTA